MFNRLVTLDAVPPDATSICKEKSTTQPDAMYILLPGGITPIPCHGAVCHNIILYSNWLWKSM